MRKRGTSRWPVSVCPSVRLSHSCITINFIHQAVDKYNETNTGK